MTDSSLSVLLCKGCLTVCAGEALQLTVLEQRNNCYKPVWVQSRKCLSENDMGADPKSTERLLGLGELGSDQFWTSALPSEVHGKLACKPQDCAFCSFHPCVPYQRSENQTTICSFNSHHSQQQRVCNWDFMYDFVDETGDKYDSSFLSHGSIESVL